MSMKALTGAILTASFAAILSCGSALADPDLTPDQKAELQRLVDIQKSLHPTTGDVPLLGVGATLHLGKSYYFLDAGDSKKVLTDVWKNPPDAANGVIGMIFPADKAVFADTWGAVITYQDVGYVSDKDAKTTDYNKLLTDMRSGEDADNAARQKQNFPPIHLVGWAQAPSYDPVHHSLIWARELKVGDKDDDTVNYDVRELGRKGVLSLNIVSTMSDLPRVRTASQSLAQVAGFNEGSRYADYQSGTDKKAAYGIAGLIAAGAGVALAQKFGIVAILILVIKKAGIVIAAGAAGVWARFRNMFKKQPSRVAAGPNLASPAPETPPPPPLA